MNNTLVFPYRSITRLQTDENGLVGAARNGDRNAFNQLVLCYQNRVYHHTFSIVKDSELAEDITQATFIKAFQSISRYRNGSFRAWLLRIATNTCYDELRRQKRQKTISLYPLNAEENENESPEWLLDTGLSVEQRVEQNELASLFQKCLEQLPDEFRSIVTLIDVCGLDYSEASRTLSIPMGTVKSRLARGRMHFHEHLKKCPEYAVLSASAISV